MVFEKTPQQVEYDRAGKGPREIEKAKLFRNLNKRIEKAEEDFENAQTPEVRDEARKELDRLKKYRIVQGRESELKRLRAEKDQYPVDDVRRKQLGETIGKLERQIEDLLQDVRDPLPEDARTILMRAQSEDLHDGDSPAKKVSLEKRKKAESPYADDVLRTIQVDDSVESTHAIEDSDAHATYEAMSSGESESLTQRLLNFMEFDDPDAELNAEAHVNTLVNKYPDAARVLLTMLMSDDTQVQRALIEEWNSSRPVVQDDENVLIRIPIDQSGTILDVIVDEYGV